MPNVRTILALLAIIGTAAGCVRVGVSPDDESDGPLDRTSTVDLDDLRHAGAIEQRLRHVIKHHESEFETIIQNGTTHRGDFSLAAGDSLAGHLLVVRGTADIRGRVLGNLVTLDGNVVLHPGSVVAGDVLALNGTVQNDSGIIRGDVRTFDAPVPHKAPAPPPTAAERTTRRGAGALGIFLTLLVLGAAFLVFARRHIDMVSRTVSHSFARSFFTGFVGQILLLPTFGIVVVGLIVSIVGILLLPFVVVLFALLVFAIPVAGYLAAAHAVGEAYRRPRSAAASKSGYRSLALGLAALMLPWIGWALFHWVPVAGALIWVLAYFLTWTAATAGFGAMLLSRAGTRAGFTGEST